MLAAGDHERDWARLEASVADLAGRVLAVQPPSWRGPASEACAVCLRQAVADLDAAAQAIGRARRVLALAGGVPP